MHTKETHGESQGKENERDPAKSPQGSVKLQAVSAVADPY